jgi:hypothetical protein
MFKFLLDPDISVKVARRVKGGDRKHHHEELEIIVIARIELEKAEVCVSRTSLSRSKPENSVTNLE